MVDPKHIPFLEQIGFTIKYEKVDSNNLRMWLKDTSVMNKQDLQGEKTDWNFIKNMSDVILQKLKTDPTTKKAEAQSVVDEIDPILSLFPNTPTTENIDFVL